jgi:1D-myo-inositol 3-kinase
MDPFTTGQTERLGKVLVAGHYCHDTIVDKDGTEHTALGGAAAYASAILSALEVDFLVVAKAGDDFRYGSLVANPPRLVPGSRTTAFLEDYRGSERAGTLLSFAPAIEPADLGEDRCAVGIACGIAGEIGASTLARLRDLSQIAIGDAQAFVRGFDAGGRVFHREPDPEIRAGIDRLDWLKLSRSEAAVLHPRTLRCGTLVTDGEHGCVMVQEGRETRVPAFPTREVDPTGAGDCFLAGFAVGLLRGWDPVESARLGAYCGALAVAQRGVPRLTTGDFAAFSAAGRSR